MPPYLDFGGVNIVGEYSAKNHTKQGGDVTEIGGELRIKGGKVTKNGTQASAIATIANDANGTQIAAAVNAIIAALEGAGIIPEGD